MMKRRSYFYLKRLDLLRRFFSKPGFIWLILPGLFLALLTGCPESSGASKGKMGKGGGMAPTPVLAAAAVEKTVPVNLSAIGTVEPFVTVSIKAQVGGVLDKVNFKEGEDVKQGDVLFVVDPRPYEAALRSAEADLAKAKAQAVQASKTNQRYTKLLKDKVVSIEEYDKAQANAESLAAAVISAQATVEKARLDLTYCTIASPVDGRTGNLMVDKGNLIKANDLGMVTINQISPIYISFSVREADLSRIKRYMAEGTLQLQAVLPNEEDRPVSGTLTFLDNSVDRATGTIRLKGTFPNQDHRLWPGQFANVDLLLTTIPNAILAPTQAIQMGQSGEYVYVVKADKSVELRNVKTGEVMGDQTQITEGLKAGEQIVTDGQMKLTDGSKVVIRDGLAPQKDGTPKVEDEVAKRKNRETPVN